MHRHIETDHATIFAGTTFTASDHYEVNFESPTYDYYYDGIRLNKKTNALSVRLKWDNENPEKEHFTRTFHPIELNITCRAKVKSSPVADSSLTDHDCPPDRSSTPPTH
jgi:hypothetical protein